MDGLPGREDGFRNLSRKCCSHRMSLVGDAIGLDCEGIYVNVDPKLT